MVKLTCQINVCVLCITCQHTMQVFREIFLQCSLSVYFVEFPARKARDIQTFRLA